MKSPRHVLFFALNLVSLAGCVPALTPANEDVSNLYQRFHGKYKAVESTSSLAVDVNFDGKTSTDLVQEVPDLKADYQNYLELRIYGPNKYRSDKAFLFTQWWPEQEIFIPANKTQRWEGEDIAYQPGLTVNYAMQGRVRNFAFTPDLTQLVIKPNDATDTKTAHRWTLPENVMVVGGTNRIRVVNRRKLYTSQGVKEVVITTVYERFTMTT